MGYSHPVQALGLDNDLTNAAGLISKYQTASFHAHRWGFRYCGAAAGEPSASGTWYLDQRCHLPGILLMTADADTCIRPKKPSSVQWWVIADCADFQASCRSVQTPNGLIRAERLSANRRVLPWSRPPTLLHYFHYRSKPLIGTTVSLPLDSYSAVSVSRTEYGGREG